MADLSPYAIAVGVKDYPTKYAGLLAYLDTYLDEIDAGRQGQANLATNFDRYARYSALTANINANNFKITNLGNPTAAGDAVNKLYADNLSFSAVLPSQVGNAGKIIETDGTSAFWSADFARKAGDAGQTFNAQTQTGSDRSSKVATTAFVQERTGLNATTLFLRG